MKDLSYLTRVDRSVLTIVDLNHSGKEDTAYWLSKPPIERLMALEALRQQHYGYGSTIPRLQRLLEVVDPA